MPTSTKSYRPETRLVHAGTLRSQFGETSEALFLTQGYVYPTAEDCEARFSGKIPGYVYSRYSNPTMCGFSFVQAFGHNPGHQANGKPRPS